MQTAAMGTSTAAGLLNAGRIRATLHSNSRKLSASHASCGIAFKEDTACSELENFHTAPMAVCRARTIWRTHKRMFMVCILKEGLRLLGRFGGLVQSHGGANERL